MLTPEEEFVTKLVADRVITTNDLYNDGGSGDSILIDWTSNHVDNYPGWYATCNLYLTDRSLYVPKGSFLNFNGGVSIADRPLYDS